MASSRGGSREASTRGRFHGPSIWCRPAQRSKATERKSRVPMSQLLIGNKFASGRHSRIYRGVYKQRDVAIKLISQPKEDRDLANLVEKQFTSEVASFSAPSEYHHCSPSGNNLTLVCCSMLKKSVFCIIDECLPGGSLRKYLHQPEPYSLYSFGIQRKYLHQQLLEGTRNDQRKTSHE